jgi:hypothetical protein
MQSFLAAQRRGPGGSDNRGSPVAGVALGLRGEPYKETQFFVRLMRFFCNSPQLFRLEGDEEKYAKLELALWRGPVLSGEEKQTD